LQKSIFYKYFRTCAAVVFSSILVLGTLFMLFASNYFKEEKRETMERQLTVAQSLLTAGSSYDDDSNRITMNSTTIASGFQTLSVINDSTVFFTNSTGVVQIWCEDGSVTQPVHTVSDRVLNAIESDGSYFESGRLDGMFPESYYTYGAAIQLSNRTIGYIFISEPSSELSSFLTEMIKMFALSSVAALILSVVVTYYSTIKMVRPLREMSAAAKKFGQGDFTSRIEVTSDDEIGQLAMSLNNMAESLSQLESMRRSFIANVSHELKTPMTSIGGFIDGILDGTIPQSEHRKYLRIVSEETQRLSRLVRSMLNLSRIEAGELKLNRTQFNIVDTICQTLFTFEQSIDQKKLDIRGLDVDKVMVDADADLTHQVVYNLIENAVKFVQQDGYISFSFHTEAGMTYVAIRNSGEGLSREELPRVFDRFYKTDRSRGIDKNGVGLGLYLVKSIVTLHGGDVIVRSVQGEYTEFVFSIPTARIKTPPIVTGREKEYAGGINSSGLIPVEEPQTAASEPSEPQA
jgi:signal transduction histidine kinase